MKAIRYCSLLVPSALLIGGACLAQTGNVLVLDGNGDYMSVADHPDLDLEAGESFSLTCWAKTATSTASNRLVGKRGDAGAASAGYELINSTGAGAFGINLRSEGGVNAGPPFGTTGITDGAWHHLAMVVDATAGTAKIYVDGALEQTSTSTAIGTAGFANAFDLHVGASSTLTAYWNGSVDELRLWSVPLSATAVAADRSATVTGTETGLLAAWDFSGVTGQTVPDLTGGHPGTLHGNAMCLDPDQQTMVVTGTDYYHPDLPTGRGEVDERLVSATFNTVGQDDPVIIADPLFVLDPLADTLALHNFRLYANGNAARLQLATAQLLGEAQAVGGQVQFTLQTTLAEGANVFWLCADVRTDADEGALVGAHLAGYVQDGTPVDVPLPAQAPLRTVLLAHKLLFSAGDDGAAAYRIPAIAHRDGQLVVAVDKRIDDNGDLPGNIDIVVRRSDDLGNAWSGPITVANFGNNGASDPALVYDRNSGDLLCLFASHNGLFASTPSNKIRFQVARSTDDGTTWAAPQEFSGQIYQPGWYAAWVASGSAHQTPSGRIVAAVGVRQNAGNTISNFMIYSDDAGLSWQTAPGQASPVGDEAKVVSLDDGRLMMSIRSPGQRKVTYTSDDGNSWTAPVAEPELVEPGVNGDLVRYTSVNDGYDTSRLLFSIASHPTLRRNLTTFVSYDEGDSWGTSRVICPGPAAYSALTLLEDGTIGMFYENGEYEQYQMNYARFSLRWLTNGADQWADPVGVPETAMEGPGFQVWPNPANTALTVQLDLPLSGNERLDVLDVAGKVVRTITPAGPFLGARQFTVPRDGLAPGMYLLRLHGRQGTAARHVVLH